MEEARNDGKAVRSLSPQGIAEKLTKRKVLSESIARARLFLQYRQRVERETTVLRATASKVPWQRDTGSRQPGQGLY
jgi:hypothetical protein